MNAAETTCVTAVEAEAVPALVIEDLTKTYDGGKNATAALEKVNLACGTGIVGLFGRNGAGKSTLLAIIANRLLPTRGRVLLDGEEVRDNEPALARIYLVNETEPFLFAPRVRAFLEREGSRYGGLDHTFAATMLAAFGIAPESRYSRLSLGQRQIVRLTAALCVNADVVLLDEPVNGLDAANRARFQHFLMEAYARRPRLMVMSTHLIDEAARVVERAVILDRGRVVDAFEACDVAERATVLVGERGRVHAFAAAEGLQVVAEERMGRLSTITVRGHVDPHDAPDGVMAGGLTLQDYCIRVTGLSAPADKGSGEGADDAVDGGVMKEDHNNGTAGAEGDAAGEGVHHG